MADKEERKLVKGPKGFPWVIPPLMEPVDISFVKALLMEMIGTCGFVYFMVAVIIFQCFASDAVIKGADGEETCALTLTRIFNISMSAGFGIFLFVYFAASFSGGHLNPAVSLGLLLSNKISVMRFVLYTIFQTIGALIGAAIVKSTDPATYNSSGGGANAISDRIGEGRILGLEILGTFFLVFTVLAATDSKRHPAVNHLPALAPLAIGISVFLAHLAMIPVDGCSINPARTFGTAAVSGRWDGHWVFWVGPFLGGVIASMLYENMFRPDYDYILMGQEDTIENLANASVAPPAEHEEYHDVENLANAKQAEA